MKRIQLFALVSALTVMGLASCRPVETEPEKLDTSKGRSVIFNVQVEPEAETKTALRLKFVPDWRYTDTDDIHIFETASTDGVASQILKANHVDIFTEDNDQKAYFHAWFDDISVIINPSGVLTKASAPVYNYTSIMSATEKEGDELRFVLPSTQYPTSTSSFDPKADFLIGKCGTTYKDFLQPDQRLNLNFIRPVAIGRFAIVGLEGSSVESVKVTFEQPIAGYTTYGAVDFEESTAEFTSDESDKVLTLLYPEGRRKSTIFNAFFLALEGRKKAVSMEVRTDSYIFTKTYPNTTWTLNKDVFNEIVIDMSTATKTALLDQQMQFKDGEGTPVSEMTYDLLENGGSIDAFDSPVFSRDSECQSEVTFASDNEAVATVDADGNIALTGAAGVAVITASADGDATHKAGEATVTITVLTPEVTFYKANAIDNGVEYLIVANSKAVKHVEAGMGFEDVTVSEGTITLDNSLLEGLLWKAAAIDAASEFAAYGTHTFACGDSKLTRESDGEGHMSLVSSVAAMSKYMAWSYNGTNFWNHSVNGEQVNDFYLTYDTTNGWIFEYQTTPTAVLFTTLKPREIAFETASYTYDRYTDDNFVAPTIEGATYTSSDPDIAEVDPATGAVTIEGGKTKTGTVTITATVAAGNGFQGASASYTIEVGDAEPAPIGKTLTMLLEPATELVAGEEYFLVSNGKVLARDGSDAVAADFDATEVAALVPSELVDNVTWTLAKKTDSNNRGNEYEFSNGGYYFGVALNGTQTPYTYSIVLSQDKTIAPNVTIQNHNVDLTQGYVYYKGNSSSQYIYYNTTDKVWVNYTADNGTFNSDTKTVLYVRKDTRAEQTVEFVDADSNPVDAITFDLANGADNFVAPTLSSPVYGDVTYSTDDTHGVITLNEATGAVTINKKGGPVTITANIAGDDDYKPATASYTLNVTNSNAKESVYNKVTSVSDLEVGAKYLIVFEGLANDEDDGDPKVFEAKVEGSELSKDAGHDVTIENGVITSDLFDEYTFTLEEGYYLKADNVNKYMYPMQKSGTGGAFGAENSATNKLTITFSNGIASIACNSRYVVWSTSSHYFSVNNSTSSNSATGICLYKLYDGRQPQNMQFAAAEAQFDVFSNDWVEGKGIPALDGNETTPVYESSNTAVATVNETTGAVEIQSGVKSGDTAVITATAPQNDSYKTATASYTIKIVNNDPAKVMFSKVTSADEVVADGTYVFVYRNGSTVKAFKPVLNSGKTEFQQTVDNAINVTITDDQIDADDVEGCEIVLTNQDGTDLKFSMVVPAADGTSDYYFILRNSSNSSFVASTTDNGNRATFAISSSGALTITRSSYNFRYSSSSNYFQASTSSASSLELFKLDDNQPKKRNLAFSASEVSVNIYGQSLPYAFAGAPTLSGNTDGVTYSVSCSDTEIASDDYPTVSNTGAVTIVSAVEGVFTITASAAATDALQAGEASYTLTVTNDAPPTYTKVSEITSGATYLIVSTDANNYNGLGQKRAFAGTTSGSVVEVDGTSGTITGDFSACEFVITSEGDATYSLKGPEGYVTGNSTVADPYIQVSSSKVTVTLTDAATLNAATSTDGLVSDAFYFYYLKNSSKEVLYLTKTTSGAINFKMGGSGRKYGVYLYKKN